MVTSRVSDMTDTFVYGTWPTMISTHRKISQTTPLALEAVQKLKSHNMPRKIMGNRVRTVSGWQESLRDQGHKMYIQTANLLEAGPSGPLSTKAPGQGIHTQARHFPKHLPPGDNKPTSKPKKKNSSRMQREKSLPCHQSRH